jgi:AraC-like DNA-binding protein
MRGFISGGATGAVEQRMGGGDFPLVVGIQQRGRPGMVVHRPRGSGDYVFVRFLEPALLSLDGRQRAEAGEVIVWGPDSPSYIEAGPEGIYNDYVHLPPALVGEALSRFPLPLARPFALRDAYFWTPLLTRIEREWMSRPPLWEEALGLCAAELALHLTRQATGATHPSQGRHDAVLREVRLRVHRSPREPWTVARMAALAGLRESRFTVLYRDLFGCPPMEDLIRARIELAQYYLMNHNLSVAAVAELTGFGNVYYFSRCFRKHVGCPPSRYSPYDR